MSDTSDTDVLRDARPEEGTTSRPSTLDKILLLRYLKREFRDDASHSAIWRREAKDAEDFAAGHGQWTPEEKSQLNAQLRPEVVFNRSLTIIRAVAGFEINSRHEIQFLPRNVQETAVNEVLTGASKWMGQDCDGEDEESEAFRDCLVTGMGWSEHRMDFELERNGKYLEDRISGLEMYWDRRARKKNLVDSKRMWRLKRMPLSDAMDLCPGFDRVQLDARWAVGLDPQEETKTLEEKWRREENTTETGSSEGMEVHIVHAQWWEREPYYLVADPIAGKMSEMSVEQYEELKKRLKFMAKMLGDESMVPPHKAQKLYRRKFKQCFIGNEILGEVEDAPCPDAFSWTCITGEPDRNKGTWFGLIAIMKDPAKWSNKFFSQIMHILNSQAKGGIFAEKGLADDERKFEENYAKPNAVTWLTKGSLSSQSGAKWAVKPVAEFPQGFQSLLEYAVSSLRDVTGINLELLGQRDMNQPGILEAMRKQAGMTVLASMFDSLRRFRKLVGRLRLYYIQTFISDGRIIRITGRDGAQAIPLIRDKCLGEYDVIVDDTPTSPNQKEANWAIIAPMLPMFKDQLAQMPELLVAILEYSPLPNRLVELLKALIAKPNPEQARAKELAVEALVAKINRDQAAAEKDNAAAGKDQSSQVWDIADATKMMEDAGLSRAQADHVKARTLGEHAATMGTHVRTAIDAMTPIAHQPPGPPALAPGGVSQPAPAAAPTP